MKTPTVKIDGHQWYQRAGKLWGNYKTVASYIGYKSPQAVANFALRHNLTRIKHGKQTIVLKDQVDEKSGAISKD
jgi:hypothetical protein